jgi:hypothetical protein
LGGALWRGIPARELEPIAILRLGLDIGGSGKVPGSLLRDIVAGRLRKISCN